MNEDDPPAIELVSKAIAYLKPSLPPENSSFPIRLRPPDCPVFKDLNNGLLVAYLVDEGDCFLYVQNRHIVDAGISEDELHSIGIANLSALAKDCLKIDAISESTFMAIMGGNFEASLVLIDSLWTKDFRQYVKGEYAMAVPARDVMCFCDAASATGRRELQRGIQKVFPTGDHPISDRIYLRSESGWKPIVFRG